MSRPRDNCTALNISTSCSCGGSSPNCYCVTDPNCSSNTRCQVTCTANSYPDMLLKNRSVIYLVECKFGITTGASLLDPDLKKKFECKIPCTENKIKIITIQHPLKKINEIISKLYEENIYLYICKGGKLELYWVGEDWETPYMIHEELPCADIVCQVCRQCS